MGLTNTTNEKTGLAQDILSYLAANPGTQDTLEGIVEWRLLQRRIESRVAQIKEALADLKARGLILERAGNDSRVHYRINRRKIGKIQILLKQRPI